jgi:hypothetical protein
VRLRASCSQRQMADRRAFTAISSHSTESWRIGNKAVSSAGEVTSRHRITCLGKEGEQSTMQVKPPVMDLQLGTVNLYYQCAFLMCFV